MSSQFELEIKSQTERELRQVIGLGALLCLEREFGGRYLYVPANEPNKELVEAIGKEAADKLVQWCGPSEIYVPVKLLKESRNYQLFEGKKAGKTIQELAEECKLSSRRIRAILKEKYGYADSAVGNDD